jgi:thiosulfate/3-mercaptopyruvate sulfurtransferase
VALTLAGASFGEHPPHQLKHRPPAARTIAPIVSASWLAANLGQQGLVVVDVRPQSAYDTAHIPGSLSEPFVVPFSAWITLRNDLLLELPDTNAIFATIGNLGISKESKVVIVTAANPGEPAEYGYSAATRVADTLIYAGVGNVSILDGGYLAWESGGYPVTAEVPPVVTTNYTGKVNTRIFVSREYVERRLFRTAIIDARDPNIYFGVATEPFAAEAGHIPSASSLPAPWVWSPGGYYLDTPTLAEMAAGVIEQNKHKEVIVYCGVGGYASVWWYLLTEVLGYTNVKFYDGAVQEWALHNELIPFRWD